MAGNMIRNSSDLAVPQKDQTGRPMEGVTSPAPLRRSVTQLHLYSQPSGYQSMLDQPRYPILDDISSRQAKPPGNQTVPDVVVQNNTPDRKVCFYDNQTVSYGNKDNAVQTAPSELAEDPTSGSLSEPFIPKPVPDQYAEKRKLEERSQSERSWQTRQSSAQTYQPEYMGSRQKLGEAIVVGAIGLWWRLGF